MTPDPPSPADGSSLPPRHRPSLGTFAKDTTEQDLWAFDDLDPLDEAHAAALPKSYDHGLPAPRDAENFKVRSLTGGEDSIQVNIAKSRSKTAPPASSGQANPGRDFADLEHWDEGEATQSVAGVPAVTPSAPAIVSPPVVPQDEPPAVPSKAPPVSPRVRWNLTKVERLGLVVLTVLLLGGGVLAFLNSISRLPSATESIKAKDFPLQGKHLTIVSAASFWRVPKPADTARRGVQLIPVVELTTTGGPAAVRVLFRNSDGDVIGDAVTRFLQSGGQFQIGATAGFDDVGMHAAYRTGDSKPWTIEVLEAATQSAAGQEFRRIFEMDVSTERR